MKNKFIYEILTSIVLIILSVLLLNPFYFWMPDMFVVLILAILFILFSVYASFVIREGASDEREGYHRMMAGRNAFLVGAGVLLLGIGFQTLSHSVDKWLVLALVGMILAKIITRIWSDRNC